MPPGERGYEAAPVERREPELCRRIEVGSAPANFPLISPASSFSMRCEPPNFRSSVCPFVRFSPSSIRHFTVGKNPHFRSADRPDALAASRRERLATVFNKHRSTGLRFCKSEFVRRALMALDVVFGQKPLNNDVMAGLDRPPARTPLLTSKRLIYRCNLRLYRELCSGAALRRPRPLPRPSDGPPPPPLHGIGG